MLARPNGGERISAAMLVSFERTGWTYRPETHETWACIESQVIMTLYLATASRMNLTSKDPGKTFAPRSTP